MTLWMRHDSQSNEAVIAERFQPEVAPCLAATNKAHAGDIDSKQLGYISQGRALFTHGVNSSRAVVVKLGHTVLGAGWALPAEFAVGMFVVSTWSYVFQVVDPRIVLVAVLVVDLMAIGSWADERQSNQPMNQESSPDVPAEFGVANPYSRVVEFAAAVVVLENPPRRLNFAPFANAAFVADLVKINAGNWLPLFNHSAIIVRLKS